MKISLKAASTQFITAEEGGGSVLTVTRYEDGEWERFEVEDRDDGKIALKSSGGFYLGVDPASDIPTIDRTQVGEWEEWELEPGETNGSVALLNAYTGKYLRAEDGGGTGLMVDRDEVHAHESFISSEYEVEPEPEPGPVPIPVDAIVGQLRTQGLAFYDDNGLVLPKILHAGSLFTDWVHDQKDYVRGELEAASRLYHGIRFWDHLGYWGGNAWGGREVGPVGYHNHLGQVVDATPDYYGKLEEFLNLVFNYGLKVHHSRGDLNGLRMHQILRHIERVKEVQERVGLENFLLNEACNEAWQNMPSNADLVPSLHAMCDLMPRGVLRATSAANDDYGGELLESQQAYAIDVCYKHGYRGGETFNRLGHIHAFAYETLTKMGKAGWEGEPTGPEDGVTVGREDNVEGLCMMAIQMLSFSQAATFMSGPGVWGKSPIQSAAGYHEWPKAAALVPQDVMTWDKIIHGGPPLSFGPPSWPERIFAVDEVPDTRVDQRIDTDTGRFIATIYGQPGTHKLPVERNADIVIYTPHTGEAHPFTVKKGKTFDVSFEKGRFVVGQLT